MFKTIVRIDAHLAKIQSILRRAFIIRVVGDGNCCYRALSLRLFSFDQRLTPYHLKTALVSALSTGKYDGQIMDLLRQELHTNPGPAGVHLYIDGIASGSLPPGPLEYTILADLYRATIRLHSRTLPVFSFGAGLVPIDLWLSNEECPVSHVDLLSRTVPAIRPPNFTRKQLVVICPTSPRRCASLPSDRQEQPCVTKQVANRHGL